MPNIMDRIIMPKSGQTMEEGVVLRWLKNEGEAVQAGEVVVEIETDKAVAEVPSQVSGVLRKILISEGETVPVLTPLAYVGGVDEELPQETSARAPGTKEVEPPPSAPVAVTDRALFSGSGPKLISPRARRLAAEHGIDITLLAGTGPDGRITESDVQEYLQRLPQAATGSRQVSRSQYSVGKQLQKSKQTVPHFYLTIDVNMDTLLRLKDAIKARSSVTVTDLMVKAVGFALQDCPEVNCRWEGDELIYNNYVNVGIAVDVEAGLLVATVPDVNKKSLPEIAERSSALIAKAKDGKVVPEPCSLTVSNLGMHGVREFAAIINPPEIAILAVGAITPVVQMDDSGGDFRVAKRMSLTLSSDHRALSGVQAARFLNSIRSYLEQPETWVSEVKV
jgi:pyruvate dehydrogenase E2 component (dihydrolipoamide acetyltransferase)